MPARKDDTRSAREVSRAERREDGERSSRLAREIMKLSDPLAAKLELTEEQREVVDRARAITSPTARRRGERALAGDLRRFELGDIARALVNVRGATNTDTAQLHAAEQWRTRLLAEGIAAAAELPGGIDAELTGQLAAAQKERDTGKPPGASRRLFRLIVDRLKAAQR